MQIIDMYMKGNLKLIDFSSSNCVREFSILITGECIKIYSVVSVLIPCEALQLQNAYSNYGEIHLDV